MSVLARHLCALDGSARCQALQNSKKDFKTARVVGLQVDGPPGELAVIIRSLLQPVLDEWSAKQVQPLSDRVSTLEEISVHRTDRLHESITASAVEQQRELAVAVTSLQTQVAATAFAAEQHASQAEQAHEREIQGLKSDMRCAAQLLWWLTPCHIGPFGLCVCTWRTHHYELLNFLDSLCWVAGSRAPSDDKCITLQRIVHRCGDGREEQRGFVVARDLQSAKTDGTKTRS